MICQHSVHLTDWLQMNLSFLTNGYTRQSGFHQMEQLRTRYTIPFILKCFRCSLDGVIAQRGTYVESDHHMLLGKLKPRLKKQVSRGRFQVTLLDDNKKDEFQLNMKN